MSPEREALNVELASAKKLLAKTSREISALEVLIPQTPEGTGHRALVLQLQTLKSLRHLHDQDCRRVRNEITATI